MNIEEKAISLILRAKWIDGCLICHLTPGEKGYPYVNFPGLRTTAHRFVWIAKHGPIKTEQLICHSCDNRRCISYDHLFLGNAQINVDDMINKGRRVLANGAYSITEDMRKQIIIMRNDGMSYQAIANEFNVSWGTIRNEVLR